MTNTNSDNSREWAAQAYALLKKKQEEQKEELKFRNMERRLKSDLHHSALHK